MLHRSLGRTLATVAFLCAPLFGGDYDHVFNVVKDDESHFARMLSTGITELPNGLSEARDVMERVGEAIHVENEKKISMLAVLGTLTSGSAAPSSGSPA